MKYLPLLCLLFSACTWTNVEDLDTDGPGDELDCNTVTLSGTIEPIIATNCALSGCHGGPRSPQMTSPAEIIAVAERIKTRTSAGTMPPSGPLPAADVEAIACWVDAGAPNN